LSCQPSAYAAADVAALAAAVQMQRLAPSNCTRIPASLLHTHLPDLAAIPAGAKGSTDIQLQLVLLPPCASDVTLDTPAQEVINFKHGISVRKDLGKMNEAGMFTMAGLPLKRSRPCQEEWFIRG
jgi:hypothetical protein